MRQRGFTEIIKVDSLQIPLDPSRRGWGVNLKHPMPVITKTSILVSWAFGLTGIRSYGPSVRTFEYLVCVRLCVLRQET